MSDLISKSEVLSLLESMMETYWDRKQILSVVRNNIEMIPSAESKKGKWVQTNPPERSDNIVCDQCGYDSIAKFIYCPNCGAKMEVSG